MEKSIKRLLLLVTFINSFLIIKSEEISFKLDTIQNYNNWGWEALVIKNEYITVAVVPEMGGNILQYDLGVDTFLLLEPNTFGKSYAEGTGMSPFDGSWGFGGYEIWPSPEGWPPPPNLTYRKYSFVVEIANADSITIFLKSEKETVIFPGLKFERKITAYNHSTNIKVENTIINFNTKQVNYGMMNVNYVRVNHENIDDFYNFPVSFPINKASKYAKDGSYFAFNQNSPSYLGQINPGVFSVEYYPNLAKVFSDVSDGWGALVDKKDSQAYIRVFNVFEGEQYPDNGARFEVYISDNTHFMAIEVMSPLKKLAANGGKYTFKENLFSTKLNNTILKATYAGASTERLSFDSLTHRVTGTLGLFYKGNARLSYYDKSHNLLSSEKSFAVYPDTSIIINETINLPENTNYIALEAYTADNKYIDILDEIDFSPQKVSGLKQMNTDKKIFTVKNNMLKNNDILEFTINNTSNASSAVINIYGVDGKLVEIVFNGSLQKGEYNSQHQLKNVKPGFYSVVFSSNGIMMCDKIIVTH